MAAYAVRIIPQNVHAIASEHPKFDRDEFDEWLKVHGDMGYFIRDEGSAVFDCKYLDIEVFRTIYVFERGGIGDLFQRIARI